MDSTAEKRSQIPAPDASYRTLLELATAFDKQTSVQAVLKSLHKLISAVLHFETITMMLLTEDQRSLRLVAFERGSAGPHVDLGVETPYAATAAGRAIEEQRTIYLSDIRQEMSQFPQTASQAGTGRDTQCIRCSNFYAKAEDWSAVLCKARRGRSWTR